MNTNVGRNGWPRSRLRRLTVAKVRIMGEALGNIIPTIITHHIANISAKSTGVHGIGIELIAPATMSGMSGIDASIPAICAHPLPGEVEQIQPRDGAHSYQRRDDRGAIAQREPLRREALGRHGIVPAESLAGLR